MVDGSHPGRNQRARHGIVREPSYTKAEFALIPVHALASWAANCTATGWCRETSVPCLVAVTTPLGTSTALPEPSGKVIGYLASGRSRRVGPLGPQPGVSVAGPAALRAAPP
jgi:hypothetical protein